MSETQQKRGKGLDPVTMEKVNFNKFFSLTFYTHEETSENKHKLFTLACDTANGV